MNDDIGRRWALIISSETSSVIWLNTADVYRNLEIFHGSSIGRERCVGICCGGGLDGGEGAHIEEVVSENVQAI